ncbi:hypothetical protein ACS0TY_026279 [Phlomoides rotata]
MSLLPEIVEGNFETILALEVEEVLVELAFLVRSLTWSTTISLIYIRLIDPKSMKVKPCISICIKDQMNNKHYKRTDGFTSFSPLNEIWGWYNFIKLNTLEDPENGFIIKAEYSQADLPHVVNLQ